MRKTWDLYKLLIFTLFLGQTICDPSIQGGGAQAGYSLYENGFDEEFRPVITIALTQLNIHRTNVTALAVHVKCGDGTGNITRNVNLSCSSTTSICTNLTATFNPRVLIGNLRLSYQSSCRIRIYEPKVQPRIWFEADNEDCLITYAQILHTGSTSTFTCYGPNENYVLSCIAGCPSTFEGELGKDNTLSHFQYIFAVTMMCFAMFIIIGGCICWHSYYRRRRNAQAPPQIEQVEDPTSFSISQVPQMMEAGSPRTPAGSTPPLGPVVVISFGQCSTPHEEFKSGLVCLGVPSLLQNGTSVSHLSIA